MRITFALFLVLLTTAVSSQVPKRFGYSQMGIRKIVQGEICDTCFVRAHFVVDGSVGLCAIGALTIDPEFWASSASRIKTSSRSISLDFLHNNDERSPLRPASEEHITTTDLEFCIFKNNVLKSSWKPATTLQEDKAFALINPGPGDAVEHNGQYSILRADTFSLNVGDSVSILIRKKGTADTVKTLSIHRVKALPDNFVLLSLPASSGLQDILNNEIHNKGIPADSVKDIVLNDSLVYILKIDNYQLHGVGPVEYRFSNQPDQWKTFRFRYRRPEIVNYILINNAPPGQDVELLIRYQDQPESIRRIKIKVKEKITSSTWFKTGAGFMLALLCFGTWYFFRKRNHKRQVRQLLLAQKEIESKLELLSGQLNPHFLFNSLNSVQALILKKEYRAAEEYTRDIALFLRTMMEMSKKEYGSLQEEIRIEGLYIQLEEKRKPFQYQLINQAAHPLSEIEFPPLLLQPVIENAIIHGFTGETPDPVLTLMIETKNRDLTVTVSNTGAAFNTATMCYGHGLSLIEKRIALLNQNKEAFFISMEIKSEGTLTSVIFIFQNWL